MGWDGKAVKILNNLIIPLKAGASKQISGIFQLFANGKCSLHISSFQRRCLILPFFLKKTIFIRKPEMTLLVSAWIQMIPALPLSEPFSVHGQHHSSLSWSDCSHSLHHLDPSELGDFHCVVKPILFTGSPKREWVIGWVCLGLDFGGLIL